MTILATVFVFGLVVLVHELGHFIAAKSVGMKVEEFAIGFGPKIISFRKGETLYSWRVIPLGGFNKIAGMDAEEELDERSYLKKSIGARALVIGAGAFMNFVLPLIVFFVIYTGYGLYQPVNQLPIPGQVIENRAAAKAGFLIDDKVVSINGKSVGTWKEMTEQIQTLTVERSVEFVIDRKGESQTLLVTPEKDERSGRIVIGIIQKSERVRVGPIDGIRLAFERTWKTTYAIFDGLKQMIISSGGVELSGPIGVARMAGEVAENDGLIGLLGFTAFLSINLGIMNLLPVPALDGGHLLVLLVEFLRGKPLDPKQAGRIQMVGVALLLSLFVLVMAQDIFRLISEWGGK